MLTLSAIQSFFHADYSGTQQLLKQILEPIFGNYQSGYDEITKSQTIKEKAKAANIKSIKHAATFWAEGLDIKLFDVTLEDKCHIHVARKNIQQLVREYVDRFEGAFIVFHYEQPEGRSWRLSYLEKRQNNAASTNAKRYTYLCGKDYPCRTIAERFYALQSQDLNAINLEKAFSVEALTKEFYGKLYNWFLWARDTRTGITFPNNPTIDTDDRDKIEVKIIRLITRMLFVWFIKQKNLVPDYLFDTDYLKTILKDFDPLSSKQGNYYNAILQNLFFATLNQECDKREFIETPHYYGRGVRSSESYGVKNLYRDNNKESWFTFSEDKKEEKVIELFSTIPYLNGGLFECLDKFDLDEGEKKYKPLTYYDGFSSNSALSNDKKNLKYRAFIPNELFFLSAPKLVTVTIKAADGNKPEETKEITVIGLIELFRQYNFTVEENTKTDTEVSLDPELLGRVFENLLAAYNPETQESARKSTGSYYTPREIVDYMVDESLKAYLIGECGNDRNEVESLFKDGIVSSQAIAEKIDHDLRSVKVLDPACGSGAFPMGILLRMTDLIEHLEGERFNRYETKLQIIKDCIYGIDIQSIAMLICKLRFFISLICDSNYDPSNTNNFGIIPLPSLETKFVAANSLLPAKVKEFDNTLTQDPVLQDMKEELLALRKSILQQHTTSDKMEIRRKDRALCKRMQQYIIENAGKPNEDVIRQCEQSIRDCEILLPKYAEKKLQKLVEQDLFGGEKVTYIDLNKNERDSLQITITTAKARIESERNKVVSDKFLQAVQDVTNWDPYDQNCSSTFFDAEWMFGIGVQGPSKQGFDIVIGNPPYISVRTRSFDSSLKPEYKANYSLAVGQYDLYTLFIEHAYRILSKLGVLSFIIPTRMLSNENFMPARQFVMNNMPIMHYVNAEKPFDSANVEANIMVCQKGITAPQVSSYTLDINTQKFNRVAEIKFNSISHMPFNIFPFVFSQDKLNVLFHIQSNQNVQYLSEYLEITRGFECGYNDTRIGKGNYPFIMAESISAYMVNQEEHIYCDPDFSKVSKYKSKDVFCKVPKLLTKFCSNEIKFAIDEVGYCNTNSVYNCELKAIAKADLYYLLGVVNSKLTTFWFNTAFLNIDSIFPHIQKNQLEAIPIVQTDEHTKKMIVELVDKIISAKRVNAQADIREWEQKIDKIVYHLYDLTPDEIALIEQA